MTKIVTVANFTSKFSNMSNTAHLMYKNPCLDLQKYLEINLFKENELLFSPGLNTMMAAENIFMPRTGNNISIISKAIHPENFPADNLPEIAFLGRSNVGKSSLIKAIFRNVPHLIVKTSKKPGHTKSVQFFAVGSRLCLVDMPGYGYRQPEWFQHVLKWYLQNRKNLVKTFLITDGQIGIQELDEVTMNILEEYRIPYAIIISKIDKSSDSQRLRSYLEMQKRRCESISCFPQPFMLSSLTHEGLAYFLAFIGHITGNLNLIE